MWTPEINKYTKPITGDDTQLGHAEVVCGFDGTWFWNIFINSPDRAYETIRSSGGPFATHADAQQAVDVVMAPLLELIRLKFKQVVVELPTDMVDMFFQGYCLLCGGMHRNPCLHDAAEVRAAFALALRLGKHVPGSG